MINKVRSRLGQRGYVTLNIACDAITARWRRDYADEGLSDERCIDAPSIDAALQAILQWEDEEDKKTKLERLADKCGPLPVSTMATSEELEDPGYPTAEELERIATWPVNDFKGWIAYVKEHWAYAFWGWHEEGNEYRISTAGWSGNESIIEAMSSNYGLWSLSWQEHRRGGHYVFRDPKNALEQYGIKEDEP